MRSFPRPPVFRPRPTVAGVAVVLVVCVAAMLWGSVQLASSSNAPRSTLEGVTDLTEIGQISLPASVTDLQSRISEGQHLWVAARFQIDPFDLASFFDDSHLPRPTWLTATISNGEDLGLGWNVDRSRIFKGVADELPNGVSRRVMVLLDNPNDPTVCVVIYRP